MGNAITYTNGVSTVSFEYDYNNNATVTINGKTEKLAWKASAAFEEALEEADYRII